ncbi:MAG: hypothetical protein CMG62_10030 [Candidatus Marinimicrobia bacterium]|nr:hypothetical protein [Candidatus Neomarinimicrobiota bacterium]|tara:strand:+ start:4445 stop:5632 length:1188 start_codon:yes stop_codon:yes gene_type:complete
MLRKIKDIIKLVLRNFGRIKPITSNHLLYIFSSKNYHTFFGYYDTSPFSFDDSLLLACKVLKKGSPSSNSIKLGYFNLQEDHPEFIKFAESNAWCWQMGSRLRWLNNKKNIVSYNSMENENYINVFQDPFSGKILDIFKYPFYDINRNNSMAISLNFSRLERLRPGYGYSKLPDPSIYNGIPPDDGLILYDIKNKKKKKLFSLEEISNNNRSDDMIEAHHYFNHVSFSPYSDHFIFFHLWAKSSIRNRRLFIYDPNKERVELLSNNLVSHYSWKSEDEILITELDNNILKYNLYNIHSKTSSLIGEKILIEDGHPSFINSSEIITDTYPDLIGYQRLLRYDITKNEVFKIGTFYSPPKFTSDNKCDLHPRLNRNKNIVCVDSGSIGRREMVLLKI